MKEIIQVTGGKAEDVPCQERNLLICVFCQVLVIIDVKPKDLGLPTEAYISVEEVHDVSHLFWAGD